MIKTKAIVLMKVALFSSFLAFTSLESFAQGGNDSEHSGLICGQGREMNIQGKSFRKSYILYVNRTDKSNSEKEYLITSVMKDLDKYCSSVW